MARKAKPLKTYKVEVHEEVHATIYLEVQASSPEDAAKRARHEWVTNGKGDMSEAVEDRWVEIDGETMDTTEEDE